ncbi:MAG TPA: caspase family protein [Thermoanaerobaculia bacterium]|nr:caspase family protein [Thermoanaerobaculia bacterium]
MRASRPIVMGIAAAAVATAAFVPSLWRSRSVRPLPLAETFEAAPFDRGQSAALFVGVRHFTHDATLDVQFAADDAVDLAHMFALNPRVSLVPPHRAVLALSGKPQKEESQRRLEELEQAGARVEEASESDILKLLQRQAALVGRDGIFIVSLATHGYVRDGIPYVFAASSMYEHPLTTMPAPTIFDIVATSKARRSLLFIDACRDRITGVRGGAPDPTAAAPRLDRRMGRIDGQVVFYAASAGQYAYDDPDSGNGVFTKAVLDGLSCNAATVRNAVTVATLHKFVERRVLEWIRTHRDRFARTATQISVDGDSENMPLADCGERPPPPGTPVDVRADGMSVTALAPAGAALWHRELAGPVIHAAALDLDADGQNEVVAGIRGAVTAFDGQGTRLWSFGEDGHILRTFVSGQWYRERTQHVVALWDDERSAASRLSIIGPDGHPTATYNHEGRLLHVAVGRPTARHARKVVASSAGSVLVLHSRNLAIEWRRIIEPASETIAQLGITDHDHDGRSEISVTTAGGAIVFLDIEDGEVVGRRSSRKAAPHIDFKAPPRRSRR